MFVDATIKINNDDDTPSFVSPETHLSTQIQSLLKRRLTSICFRDNDVTTERICLRSLDTNKGRLTIDRNNVYRAYVASIIYSDQILDKLATVGLFVIERGICSNETVSRAWFLVPISLNITETEVRTQLAASDIQLHDIIGRGKVVVIRERLV